MSRGRANQGSATQFAALERGFVNVMEEERQSFLRHLKDTQSQLDASRTERQRLAK